MKKALKAAAIAAAISIGTVGTVGVVHAETSSSTSTDPTSSLVQKLAQKFNLKTADVQAVFDANRSDMDKQREADLVSQQAQLVKDGKLTQAQSDAITAKRATLIKEREANKPSTSTSETDRKTAMEARKTALDTWLKSQGIDTTFAYLLMGGRGHDGPGGMMGRGAGSTNTTTTTTSSN